MTHSHSNSFFCAMFKLFQRHASVFALLAVLGGVVAAPYLIPENPDSPIFRSGVLSLALLSACYFPLRDAFKQTDSRTLVCSLSWGLLFAVALSLGSELYVYRGMLPGMGSMLRRLAVPLMSAPLFGGLAARAMLASRALRAGRCRISFGVFWVSIFLCWTPVLLAYFPGMVNYDFIGQYSQHTSGVYTNLHPLLHSLLSNGIITLGEMIHSRTFGMLLMSLVQMALFSGALAYACIFVQKRGAGLVSLFFMTLLFALHPIFSVMSVSMTKDTLFAAAVLMLSLKTYELIEAPDVFLGSAKQCVCFVLYALFAGMLRNNGLFALVLLFPGIVLSVRTLRRRAVGLLGLTLAVIGVTTAALNLAFSPTSNPSFQFYSIPAQQLVRAYQSGKLDEETKAEIRSWYVDDAGLIVHKHLADSAKGYLDRSRIAENGTEFMALWKRVAKDCLHEYVEAFLLLNIGSWYPDDLSHSTIYRAVSWNDKGYLQTHEFDMSEEGFFHTSLLPSVRDFYEQVCRRNSYQKYPLISVLFCTATPFWALLFACALLVAQRKTALLTAALSVLVLWLSYLFGPCTLPRYALPLFCLAPPFLVSALSSSNHDHRLNRWFDSAL